MRPTSSTTTDSSTSPIRPAIARGGSTAAATSRPTWLADLLANCTGWSWKTSWFDRSLNFNGALYDEEFTNFQFAFLGPNSLTIIENAPSARILGVETNVAWRATHDVTLSGGAAYNDATLTANFCGTDQTTGLVIPTCPNSQALALKGEQLPYIPKFKGNVTARYTFEAMGWDAHAQVAVSFQTGTSPALFTSDIANLGTMPGFAAADFSFGAEKDKRTIELFIKNAFDTHGQLNRYTPCTTSTCAPSYPGVPAAVYVVPIQPLTIGIRVGQEASTGATPNR